MTTPLRADWPRIGFWVPMLLLYAAAASADGLGGLRALAGIYFAFFGAVGILVAICVAFAARIRVEEKRFSFGTSIVVVMACGYLLYTLPLYFAFMDRGSAKFPGLVAAVVLVLVLAYFFAEREV